MKDIGLGIKEGLENFAINNERINHNLNFDSADLKSGMISVAFGLICIAGGMVGAAFVNRGDSGGNHQAYCKRFLDEKSIEITHKHTGIAVCK